MTDILLTDSIQFLGAEGDSGPHDGQQHVLIVWEPSSMCDEDGRLRFSGLALTYEHAVELLPKLQKLVDFYNDGR